MRFLADENCDRLLVTKLREAGNDVLYVLEAMRGENDDTLFRLAHAENRVLITDDLDFGHISKTEKQRPPSIVLVRLDPLGQEASVERVLAGLKMLGNAIEGHIVVIEPGHVRLRAFESL